MRKTLNRSAAIGALALVTGLAVPGIARTPRATPPAVPAQSGYAVGTGKADITPPAAELAPGGSIRDPLHARAIVVRGGGTCAVLVGLDQGGTTNTVMDRALPRVKQLTGCPEENILISATHTHSGSATGTDGKPERVAEGIVAAVTQANGRLRPARIGYGTVPVDLNVNRDYLDAKGNWVQANNPDGPSDKTLAVLAFVGGDGVPVALYLNYAMHPVDFFMSRVVSADFAGGAARFLEQRYGPDTVAIFSQGASGDQNPRLVGLPNDLMMAALGAPPLDDHVNAPAFWERPVGAGGPPPAGGAQDRYKAAYAKVSAGVDAMSWMLGESAARVVRGPGLRLTDAGTISGAQTHLQCPGRDVRGAIMPGGINRTPAYADGAPVDLKLGVLRLGDVTFVSVNGEVYSGIATRLKREAPANKLMMVTLANGLANSGYIYSDDAAERRTFQVLSSRLKPGCAEQRIIDGALALIAQTSK